MTIAHTPRHLAALHGNGGFESMKKPLLNISIDHIIPDELHLMLRVTDWLITALIETAKAYDHHQHVKNRVRHTYKVQEGALITKLIEAIRQCGVQFNIYEDEGSGKLQWPSLMGSWTNKKAFSHQAWSSWHKSWGRCVKYTDPWVPALFIMYVITSVGLWSNIQHTVLNVIYYTSPVRQNGKAHYTSYILEWHCLILRG